jgi:hypothetical protein
MDAEHGFYWAKEVMVDLIRKHVMATIRWEKKINQ